MRRARRQKIEEGTSKRVIYIGAVISIIAIISLIVTILIYWNNDVEDKMAKLDTDKISSIVKENSNTSSVSTQIGKTVEEVKEEENTKKEENKTTNTTNSITNTVTKKEETKQQAENKTQETTTNTQEKNNTESVSKESLTFIKPVDGEISKDFAKDTLLYSETLEEWTTHLGVDIKAEKTTVVKAAADGKVKSIKTDPRFGLSVIIEHSSGYETLYANLLTAEFVKVGEEVKAGSAIGTVGNTATFEIADSSHLHFEIMKNGENIDPNLYIE